MKLDELVWQCYGMTLAWLTTFSLPLLCQSVAYTYSTVHSVYCEHFKVAYITVLKVSLSDILKELSHLLVSDFVIFLSEFKCSE